MDLKVATWNMAYWSHKGTNADARAFLLDGIAPDVARVQEARPPDGIDPQTSKWFMGPRDESAQ